MKLTPWSSLSMGGAGVPVDAGLREWLLEKNLHNEYPAYSAISVARVACSTTIVDFEEIVRNIEAANLSRHNGIRFTKNKVVNLEMLVANGWSTAPHNPVSFVSGLPDAHGGNTAVRYKRAVGDQFQINNPPVSYVGNVTNALYVKTTQANLDRDGYLVEVLGGSTTSLNWVDVTSQLVADEWVRVSGANGEAITASWSLSIRLNEGNFNIAPDAEIEICCPLMEQVTGQANQNPSNYVEDYAYSIYKNGNTVVNNKVIEAQGIAIADATKEGVLGEPASTNYADTDVTGDQLGLDLTAGTGDYTVSLKGAASFTITAGTGTSADLPVVVTEGSDGHFDLTGAGTINLTLDSGTLDQDIDNNNIIQVEKLVFSTSFIPASGGGGTRNIEVDTFPSNGNMVGNDFTIEMEFQLNAIENTYFLDATTGANVFRFLFGAAFGWRFEIATATTGLTIDQGEVTNSAGDSPKIVFVKNNDKNAEMYVEGIGKLMNISADDLVDATDLVYKSIVHLLSRENSTFNTSNSMKKLKLHDQALTEAEALALIQ